MVLLDIRWFGQDQCINIKLAPFCTYCIGYFALYMPYFRLFTKLRN